MERSRYESLTRGQLLQELEAAHAREERLRGLVEGAHVGEGELRFRALFDQSSEFSAILDPDGTMLLLNQTARDVLVEGDTSVAGIPFWETPWWRDSPEMGAHIRDVVARAVAGETVRTETHDLDMQGREHTVDAVFCPIRNEAGEVVLVLALGHDITDLKQAQRTLAEKERRYRTLVEHAPEAITVIDAETGLFVDVNGRACELFGVSREKLVGRSPLDFSPRLQPDGRTSEEVAEEVLGRTAAGETPHLEWLHVDARGREIPCEVHLVRLPSGDGTLVRGATFDISERKAAERALRESEVRFETLIVNLPSVIWATDLEGNTTFISPNVEKVYGYTAEEVRDGGPDLWFGRIHPDDVDGVRAAFEALFAAEAATFELEYRIQRKDGEWIWLHDAAATTVDPGPGKTLAYGVFSDITAQKRAVENLKAAEAQLSQSQKMEAIGRLAGGVAHDFNNLLTVISAHSEFAEEGLRETDPLRADIQTIQEAARKAGSLTRQLLAFSRRQVLEPRVVDLNEIVTSVDKMLRRVIGDDVELSIVLADRLGMVMADPGQMEQVLMNLAVNSRDAMPRGGKLTIRTECVDLEPGHAAGVDATPGGPHVRISISDTGIGIQPEDLERVFEPFFTTKGEGEGTGLGLATVFGIVTQSGGHVRVSSEPGQGTTFHVLLPEVAADRSEPRQEAETVDLRGEETILVVEDDDAVRRLTTQILAGAGYNVITAVGGGDALLECERRGDQIQLLLTDMMMPKMSGKELSERVTRTLPTLKTLFMTGYTDDIELLRDDTVQLLRKPFKPRDLLSHVRTVLDAG